MSIYIIKSKSTGWNFWIIFDVYLENCKIQAIYYNINKKDTKPWVWYIYVQISKWSVGGLSTFQVKIYILIAIAIEILSEMRAV